MREVSIATLLDQSAFSKRKTRNTYRERERDEKTIERKLRTCAVCVSVRVSRVETIQKKQNMSSDSHVMFGLFIIIIVN